jgi:hypothetical protein
VANLSESILTLTTSSVILNGNMHTSRDSEISPWPRLSGPSFWIEAGHFQGLVIRVTGWKMSAMTFPMLASSSVRGAAEEPSRGNVE